MNHHPTDVDAISLAEHSYFYAGARYSEVNGRTLSHGGMYVEKFAPLEQTRETPVVMFHGGGQTGTNYIGTPDGRRGWLHDFLRAGYTVYVIDQPERGRSGHSHQRIQAGGLAIEDVERTENYLTATSKSRLWPQSRHHAQWPGTGQMGDCTFDQFYASQVEGLSDRTEIEQMISHTGVQLLDQIGPAILLTHSQAGPFGWLLADARPAQVKAIIAVEPNGPPFFDVKYTNANQLGVNLPDLPRDHQSLNRQSANQAKQQHWYEHNLQETARPYGITRVPLTFDPPLAENEVLKFEIQPAPANQEWVTGYLQAQPARQLVQLQGIPIVIMVAQASYHAPYDHLTSAFLKQAGVDNELIYLEQRGLEGNGHMIMLEKNNHQVADLMIDWLQAQEPQMNLQG